MEFTIRRNAIDPEMLDLYYKGSQPKFNTMVACIYDEHFTLNNEQWDLLNDGEELMVSIQVKS